MKKIEKINGPHEKIHGKKIHPPPSFIHQKFIHRHHRFEKNFRINKLYFIRFGNGRKYIIRFGNWTFPCKIKLISSLLILAQPKAGLKPRRPQSKTGCVSTHSGLRPNPPPIFISYNISCFFEFELGEVKL